MHLKRSVALRWSSRRHAGVDSVGAGAARGGRRRWSSSPARGRWSNDEERLIRIDPGPELGNFTGFPLNAAGRQKALAWNSTIQAVPEHQSRPHAGVVLDARAQPEPAHRRDHRSDQRAALIAYTLTGPVREREPDDLARWPAASVRRPPSVCGPGFSTGEWENGMLHVTTTHFKQMFIQRNGVPVQPVRRDARVASSGTATG